MRERTSESQPRPTPVQDEAKADIVEADIVGGATFIMASTMINAQTRYHSSASRLKSCL